MLHICVACLDIHMHAYIHTYTQASNASNVRIRDFSLQSVLVCIHAHTHIHTYIHTYTHTHIHTGLAMLPMCGFVIFSSAFLGLHTCTHIHIHIYTHTHRLAMLPMCGFVIFLVGLSWFAYTFQTPNVHPVELIFFHISLIMLLASYFQ